MIVVDSESRARRKLVALAPWAASLVATVVAVACGGPSGVAQTSEGTGGSSSSGGGGDPAMTTTSAGVTSSSGAGGSVGTPSGLPCDVVDVLKAHCISCHSSPPVSNAPMALLTYADLTAKSAADPASTLAERSVARMQSASSPMPPGAGVTVSPAEIAAFTAWIQAGYPMGDCAAPDAGPPDDAGMPPVTTFNDPPVCSSNLTWLFGDSLGEFMHPGRACDACHAMKGGKAPILSIAGTVFPTGHEPDDCVSSAVGASTIEITDKNGVVTSLKPNLSGNFTSKAVIALPYTAKLTFNGQTRAMIAPQTSGDCNSCHTPDGLNGAPGRIRLP
jgi:mono/diheme cytochrome c family protein